MFSETSKIIQESMHLILSFETLIKISLAMQNTGRFRYDLLILQTQLNLNMKDKKAIRHSFFFFRILFCLKEHGKECLLSFNPPSQKYTVNIMIYRCRFSQKKNYECFGNTSSFGIAMVDFKSIQ